MNKKYTTLLAALLLMAATAHAKLTLPALCGNNMVLQQQTEVLLWGKSDAVGEVTITPSWNNQPYTAPIQKGAWEVLIPTPEAGEGYTITVSDATETHTLTNVLLGEVWLCAGQSNMVMPFKGFWNQPVAGASQIVLDAKESTPLRLFKVKRTLADTPQAECGGEWLTNTPENVASFGAVSYYFGKQLQESLGVPVGIINSSWGGSPIESWMSREMLDAFNQAHPDATPNYHRAWALDNAPTQLYNGMMHPLRHVRFKGFTWYQGESNRFNYAHYCDLFQIFASTLRSLFKCGEYPIYYVQTAPYLSPKEPMGNLLIRLEMARLEELVPRCGMVTLTDIGEERVIHPRHKAEVGHRLALWALWDSYGSTAIEPRAPRLERYEVVEATSEKPQATMRLWFKHAPMGIHADGDVAANFEIAGEEGIFYPAEALLLASKPAIEVWSNRVAHPVAVRYACRDFVVGNIFSQWGIPLSSFRTDNWELQP